MNLFWLAARNLARNRRRTLLTVGGIGVGLGIMHTSNNFAGGSYEDLLRTGISTMAGHVVVQGQGWQDSREPSITVDRSGQVAERLREAFPGAAVTRRAFLEGLLLSPRNAAGTALTAVEPEPEAAVGDMDEKVVEGSWLDQDPQGILIGANMAEMLGVEVGDKVVFMAQEGGGGDESSGEMVSRLFRVKGVFKTGANEIDGFVAYSRLEAAQEILGGQDPATQVALHLPDPEQSEEATGQVAALLGRPDVETLSWKVALRELNEFLELDARYSDILFAIIGLMVAMGVLNTVLMSVLERTRELGVMMALGLRPGRLARLVLAEGLLIGVVGAALGYALGALGSWPLVTSGVDFSGQLGESYETAGVPMNTHIYATFNWGRMGVYSAFAVFATLIASAWPALKVSRLKPVEAMHHQ